MFYFHYNIILCIILKNVLYVYDNSYKNHLCDSLISVRFSKFLELSENVLKTEKLRNTTYCRAGKTFMYQH